MLKYTDGTYFHTNIQINAIINWIKDYFITNGNPNTKAVIGISGGKDSTVAAALLVKALGPDRVIGVLMPEGRQLDIHNSYEVCEHLGIKYYEINIGDTCTALYEAIDKAYDYDHCVKDNPAVSTNAPARIRMTTLYTIASLVGGRVCHTGNASEAEIGYTTKFGDLAGDFSLLQDFTVTEILEMGDALELPFHLVHKAPSDGMSGKTDEEKIGLTYNIIDNYIRNKEIPEKMEDYERLRTLSDSARHKNRILYSIPSPYRLMLDEEGKEHGGYF